MSTQNIWNNPYNPFQRFKVLAWYDRMKSVKVGKFQAPVNIALDILSGTQEHKLCGAGFKCTFCMSNLEEEGKIAKIEPELLFTMPKFFSEWGVKSLCIAGHNSDPCMYPHKDLIKFLNLCKEYNIEVGFVSNGAYFSEELLYTVARTCNWTGFSVNAGNENDHHLLTNSPHGTFKKVIDNMKKLSKYVKENNLNHDVGYKFLITELNFNNILEAIQVSKESGARHMQIRPCELPEEKRRLIDTDIVEKQIQEGLKLEVPGQFEIFGIREKFKADFSKNPPKRCIASPLGSTFMASGDVVICPDRRWSAHLPNMTLGNFVKEGLESIKKKWGGNDHIKMIEEANKNLDKCIRCTAYSWHEIYEHCVENDDLDISLI